MKRLLKTAVVIATAVGGVLVAGTASAANSKAIAAPTGELLQRSAQPQSVTATSLPLYSNLGTDAAAALLNGGVSTSGTTRYTSLSCSPLTLAQPGEQQITAYSVVLKNQNAAAFTPTNTIVAFYDNSGANGGPGKRLTNRSQVYYGGGVFTGPPLPANGTLQLNAAPTAYTATYVPAPTAGTVSTVWGCVYFAAPTAGVASLANLGIEKYANAPTAGSTSDLAFISTVGVATPADNPAGTLVAGSGVANVFGWELTTLGSNTLLDSVQVRNATGQTGTAGYAVNSGAGIERNFSGYAATISAPPLASGSWSATGLVLYPSCTVGNYTDVQATIKFWNVFNGSTAADVFADSAPIAAQTLDLGAFNCTSATSVLQFPVRLPTPVSLGAGTTMGITVEYLADSGSGLAPGMFYELLQNAPAASPFIAVGTNASTGATGWYKSASNRADRNFTGTTDYVTATRQHLVLRVYADMVAPTHTVTASTSGPGTGTISPPGASLVNEGATVAYTLTPAAGNHLVAVTGTCGGTLAGSTFTTTAITADCTVNAFFATGSGSNGVYYSPTLNHALLDNPDGTTINFTTHVLDDTGPFSGPWDLNFWDDDSTTPSQMQIYAISTYAPRVVLAGSIPTVLLAGDVVGPASTFSTGSVAAGANWTAGANGYLGVKFNCNGRLNFPVSGNVCYGYIHMTTTAGTGYPATIVEFGYDGDGNAVTIPPSGTSTFTVSATAGANGLIDPSSQSVTSGSTATLTLYPDAGYHVDTVIGCGGTYTTGSSTYTTGAITADCAVNATFAVDVVSYTVTPVIGTPSGTITPNTPVSVASGATTSFDVAAASGFHLVAVSGCGGAMSDADTYTTGPVTSDCTVTADFAANPAGGLSLTVGLTPGGDGSTCGVATSASVNVGDVVDFCYTVTNNSSTPMAYSTLDDSVSGNIFTNTPTMIAANGGTYVYHRSVTASASGTFDETWTSRDLLPGYAYNDTGTSAFVDISGSGTALGYAAASGDDEIKGVTMPFAFSFYGASSDKLCVSNNGLMFFGVGEPCPTAGSTIPWFGNLALPAATLPNSAILPFWDDFGNGPGDVYYATQGVAPARKFIVQWNNIQHFSTTPQRATFEAVLDEATGAVSFEYLATMFGNTSYDNGISATVGLQSGPALANQYSFNTASLSAGKSIVWTSGVSTVLTANASVSLDVGAPVIDVTPTSITASTPSGSSTPVMQNLSIANTGDRDLTWDISEASSNVRAHFPATRRSVVHKFDPSATANADPVNAEARAKLSQLQGASNRHSYRKLLGGGDVPAYSFSGFSHEDYLSLDLASPSTLTSILDPQAATIYAASFIDNDFSKEYVITDTGNFGTVDTATGAFTQIGPVTGGVSGATYLSMRWDATNGKLYALADDPAIYTIDPMTGAATLVGGISGPDLNPSALIVNMAISPDGLMYGIDIADDVLLAIDKTNGDASVIGATGVAANFAQGMDFDPVSGILYWAGYQGSGNSNIYTVDLLTGAATLVGPVADGAELFGLAIAIPSGGCAQPEDVSWLSISPTSGIVVVGDPADVAVVTLNPTGMSDGLYKANVCVNSNDPVHRVVSVPVSFTVGNVDPTAVVNPTSLTFTVEEGGTDSGGFSITNSGDPGSVLDYAITEAVGSCGTAADSPWLSATPTSGSVPIGTPASVGVAVDSTGLAVGSYSAILCLATNDPTQATIPVSISFTVTLPDLIFADGFDPASPLITGTINQPAVPTGDGSSFDFVTGSFHGYDAGITADDINLYTLGAPAINVYWYGDAVPAEFTDLVGGVVATSGGTDFRVLQSGDVIDASSPVSAASQGADMSAFEVGVNGYIGIAFYNESSGALNFGYLHVQTSAGGFPIQVLDYGYDPTGAGVTIP